MRLLFGYMRKEDAKDFNIIKEFTNECLVSHMENYPTSKFTIRCKFIIASDGMVLKNHQTGKYGYMDIQLIEHLKSEYPEEFL